MTYIAESRSSQPDERCSSKGQRLGGGQAQGGNSHCYPAQAHRRQGIKECSSQHTCVPAYIDIILVRVRIYACTSLHHVCRCALYFSETLQDQNVLE